MFIFKEINTAISSYPEKHTLIGWWPIFIVYNYISILSPLELINSQKEIFSPPLLIAVQAYQSSMYPVQVDTHSLECCFFARATQSASPCSSNCSRPDAAWCLPAGESVLLASGYLVCLFLGPLPVSILVAGRSFQLPASVSHTDSSCWNLLFSSEQAEFENL